MDRYTRHAKQVLTAFSFFALFAALALPAQAQTGESLYKTKCASCHGANGKGDTPAGKAMKVKDFASDEVKKMSDADLSEAIAKGKAKMPAFKTLTADQVKDLVAYVRGLQK